MSLGKQASHWLDLPYSSPWKWSTIMVVMAWHGLTAPVMVAKLRGTLPPEGSFYDGSCAVEEASLYSCSKLV